MCRPHTPADGTWNVPATERPRHCVSNRWSEHATQIAELANRQKSAVILLSHLTGNDNFPARDDWWVQCGLVALEPLEPRKPAMLKQWMLAAAVICGVLMPATVFARAWRDQKGNIINADFVKVEGSMIYLKPENKYASANPFPFYDFSEADQDFVKAILKKKGQEDRIPPPPPKKDNPNGIPDKPNVGGVPVTVVPNAGPARGNANGFNSPPGTIPDIPNTNPQASSVVPIAVTPTVPPAYTPPANPVPSYSPPPSPNLRLPNGPQVTESKQCLSCKKEIPLSSSVGQKCPHCGVFWAAEQNQFGQVTNTAPGSSSNDWMYSRGAIRLAFLIGAFVIGGIVKIVHDNK